jgi:hypothetical protein
MDDFEVHPVGTGETVKRFTHRLCVNCGRFVEASHDRREPFAGCASPDACTFDMTMEEALNYWRKKAHEERERADKLETTVKVLSSGFRRVKHLKRGSTYKIIGHGKIQTETPLTDNAEVVVYVSEADGSVWVRPISEFMDGRFENL